MPLKQSSMSEEKSSLRLFVIRVETSGFDLSIDCVKSLSVLEYDATSRSSERLYLKIKCRKCEKSKTSKTCKTKQARNQLGSFNRFQGYELLQSEHLEFAQAWSLVGNFINSRLELNDNALLITYNAENSAKFIQHALRSANLPLPKWKWVCLRVLASRLRVSGELHHLSRLAKARCEPDAMFVFTKVYRFLESRISKLPCGSEMAIRRHMFTFPTASGGLGIGRKSIFEKPVSSQEIFGSRNSSNLISVRNSTKNLKAQREVAKSESVFIEPQSSEQSVYSLNGDITQNTSPVTPTFGKSYHGASGSRYRIDSNQQLGDSFAF